MEHNPYASPRAQGDVSHVRRGNLPTILVVCLYLLLALNGAVQVTRPESAALRLILSALTGSTATYWCVVDSRILGRPIVQSLHWIMFFTWPVAVPLYLVYSRKLRGLGIAVIHAIGLLIVTALATFLAGYITYGNLWLTRLRH